MGVSSCGERPDCSAARKDRGESEEGKLMPPWGPVSRRDLIRNWVLTNPTNVTVAADPLSTHVFPPSAERYNADFADSTSSISTNAHRPKPPWLFTAGTHSVRAVVTFAALSLRASPVTSTIRFSRSTSD